MFDKKNKRGFTLLEMLVSVSIIATMSGIVLVNYRKTNNIADVKMAAQKLASDIRMVQNYAMSLKEFENSGTPEGGWGLRIERYSNKVVIFADRDGSKKYRLSEDAIPAENERFKELELPENITFNIFVINNGAQSSSNRTFANIVFLPPDPETFIGGAINESNDNFPDPTNEADEINIELIYQDDPGTVQAIRVNKFGLVEVL